MLSGLSFSVPLLRAALGLYAAALVASCASAPAPLAGADPSDPQVRVPPAAYRSAFERYSSQRPVEPSPWREQNERVAPQPKE